MADLNRVVEIGRLTRDMELKYTPGGMSVGNIGIAVNRHVKKGQSWEDEANFFEVTIFGKQAESLQKYLTKGKQIAVDGFLKQERWEKDGQKFSTVKIIANDVQLLGGGKDSHNNSSYNEEQDNYIY